MARDRVCVLLLCLFLVWGCHSKSQAASQFAVNYVQEKEGTSSSTEFIDSIVSALVGAKDVVSRAYTSYKESAVHEKDRLESGVSWFEQLEVSINLISAQIPYIQKVHAENLVTEAQRQRQEFLLSDLDSFLKELKDQIPTDKDRGRMYRALKIFFADEIQLEKMYRLVKAYEKAIMLWLTKAGYTALLRTTTVQSRETRDTLRAIAESSSKKSAEEEVDEAALVALRGRHDLVAKNSHKCYDGFPWKQSSLRIRIDRWIFIQEHITYLPETVQESLRDSSWSVESLRPEINPFSEVFRKVVRAKDARYLKRCERKFGVDMITPWDPTRVIDYAKCLDYLNRGVELLKHPSCFGDHGESGSLEGIITTLRDELLELNRFGYDHLSEVSQYDIVGLQWATVMASMKTDWALTRDDNYEVKALEKYLAKTIMGREGGMLGWYNDIVDGRDRGHIEGIPQNIVMLS